MKKAKIAATLLALSMATSHQVYAFGLGDLTKAVTGAGTGDLAKAVTGSSASSNVSGNDVDAFIQTARQADQLINQSARLIYLALASQEEKAKHEAAIQAANEISDVSEKKAKLDQINADTATALQKTLNNQETVKTINQMNAAQRKNLAASAFNFMLGLMKDKELAQRSTSLVSGVSSNPMLAPKLVNLKEAVGSVSGQVTNGVKIADGLISLAKAGNIKIMPASTSEKPMVVTEL
ncbi:hypothetical protein BXU06_03815 [Aquaspirillum sp. LM1]|uniref:hypothetical protein n=1 Tax=Aquaspirillum sp. LM1 TaxID=1938604 RepID=UPI000983F43E|nr:hypothetical protein [Aquaspirillum sp. LM1]AQR64282.1 hypothetical protein BXU06_03815 [Aquaspirillum sp. LM1]